MFPSPTTGHEIEVILARQLAGYMTLPVVIIDPSRVVVYYNEPFERMLGRRFDEGVPVPAAEWAKAFEFTDESGVPLTSTTMPLAMAVRHQRVEHARVWMRGLDGVRHHMDETAIPLIGNAGRFLGAFAVFSEIDA